MPRLLNNFHEPNEKWNLEIRIAGESLQTQTMETKSTANGWKQWDVDLSKYAGQKIWLVVQQTPDGNPAHGYWKWLDVVY